MDIELEKLKKLEHALHDAIDILRDWQAEEAKPEEEKYIVYLVREPFKGKYCYLTACLESRWEIVQKEYGAKTKLFVGAYDEVQEWYKARDKFASVIKAWEDGKKIQVTPKGTDKWLDLHCEPKWDLRDEYRVKPECPCEDGMDSKACVGCEHSEEGKPEFKPYGSVEEFIQDYQERFPTVVPRPAHTMPLIWIAHKTDGTTRLIVEFSDRSVKIGCKVKPVDFGKLFEYWTYTDGSPVGMEAKE